MLHVAQPLALLDQHFQFALRIKARASLVRIVTMSPYFLDSWETHFQRCDQLTQSSLLLRCSRVASLLVCIQSSDIADAHRTLVVVRRMRSLDVDRSPSVYRPVQIDEVMIADVTPSVVFDVVVSHSLDSRRVARHSTRAMHDDFSYRSHSQLSLFVAAAHRSSLQLSSRFCRVVSLHPHRAR